MQRRGHRPTHGCGAAVAFRRGCLSGGILLLAGVAQAQTVPPARVNILLAEDLRAPTARDLAILQAGARSLDGQTSKLAIRALGRLERPSVIPALVPALKHPLPENRAEAANALAQAAQGWKTAKTVPGPATPASVLSTLIAALEMEEEPSVRAAICESLGRLPFRAADQVARAEAALLEVASGTHSITDRLGVVKGFEALVRIQRTLRPPGPRAIATLRVFVGLPEPSPSDPAPPGTARPAPLVGDLSARPTADPLRDARVRRLALEALLAAEEIDEALLAHAGADPDVQVRRLAVRAATIAGTGRSTIVSALQDPAPMVRLEAVRGLLRAAADEQTCMRLVAASSDPNPHVALLALDELSSCGSRQDAITRLESTVNDLSTAGSPRGWHRAAHALVALAVAAPDRGALALGQFTASRIWQLRMYAARAATALGDRGALEKLARDPDDNVVEAAVDGLVKLEGDASDAVFVTALSRPGYQAVRAAALALEGASDPPAVVPALQAALARLITEGRENSQDTRAAIAGTLMKFGASSPSSPSSAQAAREAPADLARSATELRRLAAPRARVTIRGVGAFDLVLFTSEAPATVLRFAQLAESRYYDGLTFHRVVPNYVVQGGSPGANEYIGEGRHMRDEVGLWPHVRGAVGISTRGRDTGDAQIFINLVDSPRLDHEYTVFAQVLNGLDVVDRILEGDVIERIEIIP
jgi:cyclophilin family peptidyl-prolyl cis-trans isomerase